MVKPVARARPSHATRDEAPCHFACDQRRGTQSLRFTWCMHLWCWVPAEPAEPGSPLEYHAVWSRQARFRWMDCTMTARDRRGVGVVKTPAAHRVRGLSPKRICQLPQTLSQRCNAPMGSPRDAARRWSTFQTRCHAGLASKECRGDCYEHVAPHLATNVPGKEATSTT